MAVVLPRRATLGYQDEITESKLVVVLNGTEYKVIQDGNGGYGYSGLTTAGNNDGDYPFYIIRESGINYVYVDSSIANSFTIAIKSDTRSVEVDECFEKAVRQSAYLVVEDVNGTLNHTWQEISNAMAQRMPIYLYYSADDSDVCVSDISVYTSETPDGVNYAVYALVSDRTWEIDSPNGYPTEPR